MGEKLFSANLTVLRDPRVNDPAGNAILAALHAMGFPNVTEVRIGKSLELSFGASSLNEARNKIEGSQDLFAKARIVNPTIEELQVSSIRQRRRGRQRLSA